MNPDWVWEIYQLFFESPKSLIDIYKYSTWSKLSLYRIEQVSAHNTLLSIIRMLEGLELIYTPTPINSDKPVYKINENGDKEIEWPSLPKGHWKIYLKKRINRKKLDGLINMNYY